MSFILTSDLTEKEVIRGYKGRAIHTGNVSLMYWTVDKDAVMPVHQHKQEQIAHVLDGSFELTVNGETKVLVPGMVAVIPPFIPHGGKALTPCSLLDIFYPEREDYKFDESISK